MNFQKTCLPKLATWNILPNSTSNKLSHIWHTFLTTLYLFPAVVIFPSDILLLAKFFHYWFKNLPSPYYQHIYPGKQLNCSSKMMQLKTTSIKERGQTARELCRMALVNTVHLFPSKWPCVLSCQNMKCRRSVSQWNLHVMNTCSEIFQICATDVTFMILIIITQFYWLIHLWGN